MAHDEDRSPRRRSADRLIGLELDGRYALGRRVATGGMGAIYEGTHLELGRKVAVKVLSDAFIHSDEAVARFQREARASSRIDHPNIVAILDLGRLSTGEPYLVMELLEGEDLAALIAHEAPMPPARVVKLLAPIAHALDTVHAQGLLHRDIKPGNIFVARRGEELTPKLLDFGLAALSEAPDHERLTREGIVVGTPHYLSPEAAEGMPLDARADVYSLAVVAFELLSGVLPFDGEPPMALLYAKVRRPAPTLSQRTDRRFDPAVEQVIARGLSRDPSRRPSSAGELVRLLREAAERLPADATSVDLPRTADAAAPTRGGAEREPSDASAFSLPLRGPSERWSFAGACLLLVIALSAGWAWLAEDGGRRADGREIASRARVESGPRIPTLDLGRAEARPEQAEDDPPPGLEPPPEAELRRVEPSMPARSVRRSEAIVEPDRTPPSEARSSAVDERAAPHADDRNPERAAALCREAGVALLRGQFPRARTLYLQATYADDQHASAWRGLGLASERMGMTPEALRAYRRYLRVAPTAGDASNVRARVERLGQVAR